MCFSPQRRTIFRPQNVKKCSEPHMFFATAGYNFSTSELPKVLRNWRVLYTFASKRAFRHSGVHFSTSELQKVLRDRQFLSIFTSKCAFRHSGVQFLMSPLSTYLRTRRFNRPTFRLTRHTNHWKNTAFRDCSNISRRCIFFLLTFALVHLLPSDLTACLICFSTVHIVGSLLFKLPSMKILPKQRGENKNIFDAPPPRYWCTKKTSRSIVSSKFPAGAVILLQKKAICQRHPSTYPGPKNKNTQQFHTKN